MREPTRSRRSPLLYAAIVVVSGAAILSAAAAAVERGPRMGRSHPEVTLFVCTPPGAGTGEVILAVGVRTRNSVSKVLASVDGDIVGGRTSPPYEFRLKVGGYPVTICAVADDRQGNAGRACRTLEQPPPVAGCLANSDCSAPDYCSKPPGRCGAAGICVEQPAVCTQEYDPVCGCDGATYSSAACAAVAGVSVASYGPCP